MDFYRAQLGVSSWSSAQWAELGSYLLARAPLQLLLGPVAVAIFARRHGYLGVTVAILVALFVSSIGYTSGRAPYAARVLAPALVLLSVLIGAWLAELRRPAVLPILTLTLAVLLARAVIFAAIYPLTLYPEPNSSSPRAWPEAIVKREPNAPLSAGWGEEVLPQLLPRSCRRVHVC